MSSLSKLRKGRKATIQVTFYNCRVGRGSRTLAREIEALLTEQPAILGLCETTGYQLPKIAGYKLIRDRSNPSRANVAAYVRKDLPVSGVRWIDLNQTWGRTQATGQHEARSYLLFFAARIRVIVLHQPPRWTDNELPAQWEGIKSLAKAIDPRRFARLRKPRVRKSGRRPRVAIGDFNRRAFESGPSPRSLADRVGGTVVDPRRIDTAVICNASASKVRLFRRVDGVRLGTDHLGAFAFDMTIAARAMKPRRGRHK